MPRQARLDSPGTLHHVMIRGIEGRRIVDDDQDRSDFVRREKKGVRSLFFTVRDEHTSPSFPNHRAAVCYAPLLADLKARVRLAPVRFSRWAFAPAYPTPELVQQVVAQIPWSDNLLLLHKPRQSGLRQWHASKTPDTGRFTAENIDAYADDQ